MRIILKHKKLELLLRQNMKNLQDCDLIFMPVTPTTAFNLILKKPYTNLFRRCLYYLCNLAGLGGISVPVAKDKEGLNISAQLICKAYDEQTLLDGALSLEQMIKN